MKHYAIRKIAVLITIPRKQYIQAIQWRQKEHIDNMHDKIKHLKMARESELKAKISKRRNVTIIENRQFHLQNIKEKTIL